MCINRDDLDRLFEILSNLNDEMDSMYMDEVYEYTKSIVENGASEDLHSRVLQCLAVRDNTSLIGGNGLD